jgi:hypothetical protein
MIETWNNDENNFGGRLNVTEPLSSVHGQFPQGNLCQYQLYGGNAWKFGASITQSGSTIYWRSIPEDAVIVLAHFYDTAGVGYVCTRPFGATLGYPSNPEDDYNFMGYHDGSNVGHMGWFPVGSDQATMIYARGNNKEVYVSYPLWVIRG